MKKFITRKVAYKTRSEALAASKVAFNLGAKMSATGLHSSDYPSEKPGACSFDDDFFYVVFPIINPMLYEFGIISTCNQCGDGDFKCEGNHRFGTCHAKCFECGMHESITVQRCHELDYLCYECERNKRIGA